MLLALQRSAGNSAVTALLAAKTRPGADAKAGLLDAAIGQARRDDPDLRQLEDGLRAAKSVGVAVDIDGADAKPPASALAVTRTGFGPASVAAKPPAAAPKPVPALSPLAKAARPRPAAPKPAGAGAAPKVKPLVTAPAVPALSSGPVDVLAPPAAPERLRPQDDPAFAQVTGAATSYAKAKRAHPPAAAKAREAQNAALPPANDVASQAEAAKLDTMNAQPAGAFDKKAFIAAVKAAIEAKAPKSLEQADEYKKSGQASQVKGEVKGLVGGNKQQSAEAIETATAAPPDSSKAVAKPVVPMTQEDAGAAANIPAGGAVPKPAPAEQLNLAAGPNQANMELDQAEVSEQQLAQSNEPEFTGAVAAKQEAAAHSATAPAQFRDAEAATLTQAKSAADADTKAAVTGIQAAKGAALAQVTGTKTATKGKDEGARAKVSADIQAIFAAAQTEVKKILDDIDPKVDKAFEDGEKAARASFEGFVEAKMSAYKRDRYGGWLGGLKWAKDKLVGMPSAVNEFFEAGREVYLKEMDGVISRVADIVGKDLGDAKLRIAKGKADVAAYVKTLGPELAKVGAEAAEQVADQFGKLESDVDEKQNGLVDSLASKYVEARKGLDDRIEALQAENKGLVDKAIGAIKGVIETILKLKDMLLGVLARAAAAVGKIIKDPIGFLGNFVNAVKSGIVNFGEHIYSHLTKGLQKWLFGALSEGGIELPEKFDLKGVVQLVLSILGLTWERIKARIFAKVPGLQVVWDKVVGAFEVIKILVTEGVGGLWKWVLEKAGDIKQTIMTQIQEMVAVQIIKAGVTWLISMLNPAGAFIKACKMIYDVVMFFVDKAAQIKEFVDSVLDSVESIAAGGVGAVADKIEQTLARLVPILIGFLASLLGFGGIADKIKKIIETVQKPVMKVVDWVVGKAVGLGKKFLGSAVSWAKGKAAKGKAYVKGKVAAGKKYVKARAAAALRKLSGIRDKILGVAFRASFEADGEKHSVYTKKGRPKDTFTASVETPSERAAPTPAVKSIAAEYRALVDEWVALGTQMEKTQNASLAPRVEQLGSRARAKFNQLVAETHKYILSKGRKSEGRDPMKSADGIGDVQEHGKKGSSHRGEHRLLWTESEHVIPFATGKQIWRELSLYLPSRGSREDNKQWTVMIYERAARMKTDADNAASYTMKALVERSGVIDVIKRGRTSGAVGLPDAAAADAFARVKALVEMIRADAVSRTIAAVTVENKMVEPGATKTNGQRRKNESPTPDAGPIKDAAQRQYDRIIDLVREEVFRKSEVVEKVEGIKRSPVPR